MNLRSLDSLFKEVTVFKVEVGVRMPFFGVRMHIFCESPFFAEGPRDFYAMLNPIILWHFVGGGGKLFYLQLESFCYLLSFFAYSLLRPLLHFPTVSKKAPIVSRKAKIVSKIIPIVSKKAKIVNYK